jgi:hypothetical protein
MDKLNLDVTNYSDNELRDIFGLPPTASPVQINEQITEFKTSMLKENNLSFRERDNVIKFLDIAMQRLGTSFAQGAATLANRASKAADDAYKASTALTFSAPENTLVSDTPEDHPLIENHNIAAGATARVYEGRSERWYPPGGLNPINIRSIKRTLNIDTRFRDNYYSTKSTDFHISLPETFNKVVNMQLDAFEIPLSIYAINNCNSCFSILYVDTTTPPGHTEYHTNIDLSYGNYTTPFSSLVFKDTDANIVTVINNIFETTPNPSPAAMGTMLGEDLSYNIDPISGRSYFSNYGITGSGNDYEYTLSFNTDCSGQLDMGTPLPLKLGWLMGYRAGRYVIPAGTALNPSKLFSEGIANFAVPKYVYICVNDYTNASDNNFVAAFNQSTLSPHIIARIQYQGLLQNDGLYNSADDDDTLNASRPYYGPVNIQKLRLSIIDEYGRPVDFNNMDWSCTLSFDILYS